jgi:assimilatory nitrate reductase electron transfer subunit
MMPELSFRAAGPERVVVVGYGPVAARFVDELLPAVQAGRLSLLVLGEEDVPAYNRVLVADLGVGRTTREAIEVSDPEELRSHGVDVRLGTKVQRIDRPRRQVLLADGSAEPYDRLVFATGARAVVPTLAGINPDPGAIHLLPPGVTALRDLRDAERLRQGVEAQEHVIVLGGGILGLEAALAASDEGASVTVVHHGPRPLARSIDRGGGFVLAAQLRARGIRLVSDARSTGVAFRPQAGGRHRFRSLVLDDGTELQGGLLLLSCGVRPRTELAEGCGLQTGRGIRVDHRLEADTEGRIFAIGDCAEVLCADPACAECPGRDGMGPSGLIGPGWRQAEYLAARLSAEAAGAGVSGERLESEKPGVILLKARGLDLAAAGAVDAEPWDTGSTCQVAQWADPEHGRYVKMVTRAGVLEGLVCVGMPRTAAELLLLFERGAELPADRTNLFRLDALDQPAVAAPAGPDSTVCRCTGATHGTIKGAISGGCSTVDGIGKETRAGTGCGGCKERIAEMIAEYQLTLTA